MKKYKIRKRLEKASKTLERVQYFCQDFDKMEKVKTILNELLNILPTGENEYQTAAKTKHLTCDYCGKTAPDVEYMINPYDQDVFDIEHFQNICDECAGELCLDI